MNIYLQTMTKELSRRYHRHFELDPDLFMDKTKYTPYVYSEEDSDAVVQRYQKLGRVYLAVMLDEEPIGEVVLKQIDYSRKHCTLGISMRSDAYKNKGYGTQAEILALEYAFQKLKLDTVYADSLLTNLRSRHVLEKAGFRETHQDQDFCYYRCDKSTWRKPNPVVTSLL